MRLERRPALEYTFEYPHFLLSWSWAVYFTELYVNILPPSSFLYKICSLYDAGCNFGVYTVVVRIVWLACLLPAMLCSNVIIYQVVWVPPQVSLTPVKILLLPRLCGEPVPLACSCDISFEVHLLRWPSCTEFAVDWCWVFALLPGLNSAIHPLQPWCLMQS